jgi:hypothetical protein
MSQALPITHGYSVEIDLLVGSGTIPMAVPVAPLTSPRFVHMLVRTVTGMLGVYRKRPGKGIFVPCSGTANKSSAWSRKFLGPVDLVRVWIET